MGELLAEEAPVEADLVISVPDSGNPMANGFARASGLPKDDGLIKNRYVAAHLHPARPGAAQARPADEVQPAPRDRRRQARGGRRRLDRARQHHPPDRRDAEGRGGQGGPPADLRAADPPSLPLRHRHVHPRGDDRPRPHESRRSPTSSARTRSPTSRWTRSTRRSARRASATATPASPATTRSAIPSRRTASSRSRTSRSSRLPLGRGAVSAVPHRRARLGHGHQPAGDHRPAARRRRDRGRRRRLGQAGRQGARAGRGGRDRDGRLRRRRPPGPRRPATWRSATGSSERGGRAGRPRRLHAAALAGVRRSASRTGSSTCIPALLPSFPGLDADRAGARARRPGSPASRSTSSTRGWTPGRSSCSGPVPVPPSRDRDELEEAIHATEHALLPEAIRLIAAGRVQHRPRRIRVSS